MNAISATTPTRLFRALNRQRTVAAILLGFLSVAAAQEGTDPRFLEEARRAPVQQFDPTLPPLPLATWLASVAMPHAEVVWEVNDCGEQTGSPADEGRDFPACAEAVVEVTPGVQAHIAIVVGTFQQGVIGPPKLFQLYVVQNGEYRQLVSLSALQAFAKGQTGPDMK